ncbi:hypothetical protein CIPAW_15G175000 [Carya illinoinensis]|uniref:Uncharacterized protein n=1 Tax=Carya illinoinensis TaxID=32201 RepID=A0A8T1NDY8_CARIL|nr:hypothetical protein CIPAW_15G175000 [Carya illinoinensis]
MEQITEALEHIPLVAIRGKMSLDVFCSKRWDIMNEDLLEVAKQFFGGSPYLLAILPLLFMRRTIPLDFTKFRAMNFHTLVYGSLSKVKFLTCEFQVLADVPKRASL